MLFADQLGWLGNLFFIIGTCLLISKNIKGFWCNVLGNTLYLVQGILLTITSLSVLSGILMVLNMMAIYKWKKA